MVFRRLFIVLKPNFELSARVIFGHASIAPLRGILQGGSTPQGFSGRASPAKESIHVFDAQTFDAMGDGNGCGDFGHPGHAPGALRSRRRSEEHTSELQSLT